MSERRSQRLKKLRRSKERLGIRTTDGSAEVFVLPPEVLQKLGINLEKIESKQSHLSKTRPIDTNTTTMTNRVTRNTQLNKSKRKSSSNDIEASLEPSIIEKARLMKNSVFLSPTFIPSECNIPGELVISNTIELEKETETKNQLLNAELQQIKHKSTLSSNRNTTGSDGIEAIIKDNVASSDIMNVLKSNQISIILKENTGAFTDTNITENSYITDKTNNNNFEITLDNLNTGDDHPDETYLSDCSNSNYGSVDNSSKIPETTLAQRKPTNKVHIISEEILSFSKIRELKSMHSLKMPSLKKVTGNILMSPKINISQVNISPITENDTRRDQYPQFIDFKTYNPEDKVSPDNYETNQQCYSNDVINDDQGMVIDTNVYSEIKINNIPVQMLDPPGELQNLNMKKSVEQNFFLPVSKYSDRLEFALHMKILDSNIYEELSSDQNKPVLRQTDIDYKEKPNNSDVYVEENFNKSMDKISHGDAFLIDKDNNNKNVRDGSYTVITDTLVTEYQNNSKNDIFDKQTKNMVIEIANKSEREMIKIKSSNPDINSKITKYVTEFNTDTNTKNTIDYKSRNKQDTYQNNLKHYKSVPVVDVSDITVLNYYSKQSAEKKCLSYQPKTNKVISIDDISCNAIESKMCIQGVEKPGGAYVDQQKTSPLIIRSYARSNKPKQLPISRSVSITNPTKISQDTSNDLIPNINARISSHSRSELFCVCADFGKFAYYNSLMEYEHIHFLEHPVDVSDVEAIFSLFDEHKINIDRTENNICHVENEDSESNIITGLCICWNYYENCLDTQYIKKRKVKDSMNNVELEIETIGTEEQNEIKHKDMQVDTAVNVSNCPNEYDNYKIFIDGTKSMPASGIVKKEVNSREDKNVMILDTNVDSIVNSDRIKIEVDSGLLVSTTKVTRQEIKERNTINIPSDIDESRKYNKHAVKTYSKVNTFTDQPKPLHPDSMVFNEMELSPNIVFNISEEKIKGKKRLKSSSLAQQTEETVPKKISRKEQSFSKRQCSEKNNINKSQTPILADKVLSDESLISETVKCGICKEEILNKNWIDHIAKKHNYLAWKDGESILELENEFAIKKYLHALISEQCKGLTCFQCGITRKHVDAYLKHIKKCQSKGDNVDSTENSLIEDAIENPDYDRISQDAGNSGRHKRQRLSNIREKDLVKCGVCKEDVNIGKWTNHIAIEHEYMAWKSGEPELNLNNEEDMRRHLYNISKLNDGLTCAKCGYHRKQVKLYMHHVKTCNKQEQNIESLSGDKSAISKANDSKLDENVIETEMYKDDGIIDYNPVTVVCGVCQKSIEWTMWFKHIQDEHNYLAWKLGDTLDLEDDEEVRQHLHNISKQDGGLTCSNCGLHRKYAKAFMLHIKTCTGPMVTDDSSKEEGDRSLEMDQAATETAGVTECGVCQKEVEPNKWYTHIQDEHNYLAWKKGDCLDLNDEDNVRQHLHHISKITKGLTCSKCGFYRKYAKVFFQHIKTCKGKEPKDHCDPKDQDVSVADISLLNNEDNSTDLVVCGICEKQVPSNRWHIHIKNEHNYLAWKKGEIWDPEDPEVVNDHLNKILAKTGGLTCMKCGIVRKYPKVFLKHIETCNAEVVHFEEDTEKLFEQDEYKCGVCKVTVSREQWKSHKMKEHYNVAWIVGERPIDMNSPYAIEKYIKEYKAHHKDKLVCKSCSTTRVSNVGFFAHVLTCGKTAEESEEFYNVCKTCNKRYLCIYQNQHMTWHKEQEFAKERKKLTETKRAEDERMATEVMPTGRRRRAAEKAKSIIETYANNDSHNCPTCGFGTDSIEDMKSHACYLNKDNSDDSDAYVNEDSGDESPDSEVCSNISDEFSENTPVKKRYREHVLVSNPSKFPFKEDNVNLYLSRSSAEFLNYHFTNEKLFPDWYSCENERVPESELANYLPSIINSCTVKTSQKDPKKYQRFEAENQKDVKTAFVGACIRQVAWVPQIDRGKCRNHYLSVACFQGGDIPRFAVDHIVQHPYLIQIWDYKNFESKPKFVFGLALDVGTVWGIDWCPSGARDVLPEAPTTMCRLGLLAIACSNGFAYIYSVPYPSTIVQDNDKIFKLKPVAELRLSMGSERKIFQATSIKWSQQKYHTIVVVGYSDGTTAYFDLNIDSPILRSIENNVTILYPYYDTRIHNSCVTGVDVYPSADACINVGVVCSASPTGGSTQLRPGVRSTRTGQFYCATGAHYQPLWPAALLAGDDTIMRQAVNELEVWGAGRRFGPVSAWCAGATRVALFMSPLLRSMKCHPVITDVKKPVIGSIKMVPLSKKRKVIEDELAIRLEPNTYDEAVEKYGIELMLDKTLTAPSNCQVRDLNPHRFPLADVTSMSLCAIRQNEKLAIATHAGIIFVIDF